MFMYMNLFLQREIYVSIIFNIDRQNFSVVSTRNLTSIRVGSNNKKIKNKNKKQTKKEFRGLAQELFLVFFFNL